jgi:hypothetical protein
MSFSKTRLFVTLLTLFVGFAAHAQTLINMEGSPAAWRLQDYAGGTPPRRCSLVYRIILYQRRANVSLKRNN